MSGEDVIDVMLVSVTTTKMFSQKYPQTHNQIYPRLLSELPFQWTWDCNILKSGYHYEVIKITLNTSVHNTLTASKVYRFSCICMLYGNGNHVRMINCKPDFPLALDIVPFPLPSHPFQLD